MRRMFETGELILFAALIAEMDSVSSLHVVLTHAYVYISSAPILALYATKTAVVVKSLVSVVLLFIFTFVKFRMWKKPLSPRADKIIRAAMYAYIAFTLTTQTILTFTLESLSIPPIISQIPQ